MSLLEHIPLLCVHTLEAARRCILSNVHVHKACMYMYLAIPGIAHVCSFISYMCTEQYVCST